MSTFRDAIANAVLTGAPGSLMPLALEAADDVLAMPEMEAIRNFLEWFGHRHGTDADMRYVLRNEAGLPDNVVEWVVSHAFGEPKAIAHTQPVHRLLMVGDDRVTFMHLLLWPDGSVSWEAARHE